MTLSRSTLFGAVAMALLLGASPLAAQEVSVTPYGAVGPETNGFSAAAGLRVDVLGRWGGYARAAARGVTNVCEQSLPPTCNYPRGETGELAAGILYGFPADGPWSGRVGGGGGVLSWQHERDPFVEVTGDLRRVLGDRLGLLMGLHVLYAPGVERERHGHRAIVPATDVVFTEVVAGLTLRVR